MSYGMSQLEESINIFLSSPSLISHNYMKKEEKTNKNHQTNTEKHTTLLASSLCDDVKS